MPKQLNKPKLVKIRCLGDMKKFGIAAICLEELIAKGCQYLKLSTSGAHVCLHEDGTELTEEYFLNLSDNTELVLLSKGQSWGGVFSNIGHVLGLDCHSDNLINAAKKLLSAESSPKRRKMLGDLLHNLKDSSETENREDDKDWFVGIDVRFKTKSAYMNYNCQNRIRGYLKEVDGYAQTIPKVRARSEYRKAMGVMVEKLKSARYHGSYFDRTEKEKHCLCTKEGWFSCQGAFDVAQCKSLHSINPYGNRESRIIFSTWNFDHRIEKKRTVIPTLAEALETKNFSKVNLDYFYRLLFTMENLKLVHVVCHKKGAHDLTCDSGKVYKRVKRIQK